MKTGQHTPGPWFVKHCDDDYHQCMTVIVDKDMGKSNLGQLTEEESRHVVAITYHQLDPVVDAEDSHENSQLIATAPELLEALVNLSDSLDKEREALVAYGTTQSNDFLGEVVSAQVAVLMSKRMADQVIAKATGA